MSSGADRFAGARTGGAGAPDEAAARASSVARTKAPRAPAGETPAHPLFTSRKTPATPATVSNVVPTEGTVLGVLQAVTFDVNFEGDGGLVVAVRFSDDLEEVVWDGTFRGYYNNPRSCWTHDSGGYHFTIYRAGGWPNPITVVVDTTVT